MAESRSCFLSLSTFLSGTNFRNVPKTMVMGWLIRQMSTRRLAYALSHCSKFTQSQLCPIKQGHQALNQSLACVWRS